MLLLHDLQKPNQLLVPLPNDPSQFVLQWERREASVPGPIYVRPNHHRLSRMDLMQEIHNGSPVGGGYWYFVADLRPED